MEVFGLLKGLPGGRAHPFHGTDAGFGDQGGFLAASQMLCLINLVIEAVEHEIQQVRNHGFCALRFQQFHQMVVGSRSEFHQDFPDDADPRFRRIRNRDSVKIFNDLTAHPEKLGDAGAFRDEERLTLLRPFPMTGIHASFR